MSRKKNIEIKLNTLNPYFIEVIDKTSLHAGHMSNITKNSESHFTINIAAKQIDGLSLLEQHRIINQILKNEFDNGLHALSINIKTKNAI